MDQTFKEKAGGRVFTRVSRWNLIDYTIISAKNRLAGYADNYGTGGNKLNLTYFKFNNHTYPLNYFPKLVTPIQLEDHVTLSRKSTGEDEYYLEINETRDKVRLYKLVG